MMEVGGIVSSCGILLEHRSMKWQNKEEGKKEALGEKKKKDKAEVERRE